jgi:hypothetical protein
MKKICDAGSPELSRKRSSVSAVYEGSGARSSRSLAERPSTPLTARAAIANR